MSAAPRIIGIEAEELDARIEAAVRRALGERQAAGLVGPEQVAEALGVKRSSIPSLVARDGLPCVRVGRAYRFRMDAVLAWCEERAVRPGSHVRKHMAVVRDIRAKKKG